MFFVLAFERYNSCSSIDSLWRDIEALLDKLKYRTFQSHSDRTVAAISKFRTQRKIHKGDAITIIPEKIGDELLSMTHSSRNDLVKKLKENSISVKKVMSEKEKKGGENSFISENSVLFSITFVMATCRAMISRFLETTDSCQCSYNGHVYSRHIGIHCAVCYHTTLSIVIPPYPLPRHPDPHYATLTLATPPWPSPCHPDNRHATLAIAKPPWPLPRHPDHHHVTLTIAMPS